MGKEIGTQISSVACLAAEARRVLIIGTFGIKVQFWKPDAARFRHINRNWFYEMKLGRATFTCLDDVTGRSVLVELEEQVFPVMVRPMKVVVLCEC